MLKTNIKTSFLTFSLILFTNLINASDSDFKKNFPNLANMQVYGYPFGQLYEILQLEYVARCVQLRKLELGEFFDLSLITDELENTINDERGHDPKLDSCRDSELEKFIKQNGKEIPARLIRLNTEKRQGLPRLQTDSGNKLSRSKTLVQADRENLMQRSTTLTQVDQMNEPQRSKTLTQEDNKFQYIARFNLTQINLSFQNAWLNNTYPKDILIAFLISLINDKINLRKTSNNEFENILNDLIKLHSQENSKKYNFSAYTQARLQDTIDILEKITTRTELSMVY